MSVPAPAARPLRWRPGSLWLLGSGGALLVGAVALRSPVPIFLALPLLLAPAAAAWSGPRGPPRVTVDRHAEGTGQEVRLVGAVRASPGTDARELDVRFDLPPGLEETRAPTLTRTANELRFEFAWRAPEPTVGVGAPPRIVWQDACGLVERDATFVADPLVVGRYPPELLRVGAVRLRRTTVLPGETPSAQLGATGEFHGLRNATPQDPPRAINWGASARSGRLVANEFELDRTGDLLLLLDARGTSLGAEVDERLLSLSRAAATAIAESFLHEKARVGVGVFGEFLDVVPLATGRAHRLRVRERLRGAHLGPVGVPSERGAVAVSRYFARGTTTLLLSSLADEPAGDLVLHLRRRGYPVIVLSPSPVPILAQRTHLSATDEELGARLVQLERRARIAGSWSEAPTIDWDDYWSLGRFVEYLRYPVSRRGG